MATIHSRRKGSLWQSFTNARPASAYWLCSFVRIPKKSCTVIAVISTVTIGDERYQLSHVNEDRKVAGQFAP